MTQERDVIVLFSHSMEKKNFDWSIPLCIMHYASLCCGHNRLTPLAFRTDDLVALDVTLDIFERSHTNAHEYFRTASVISGTPMSVSERSLDSSRSKMLIG